MGIGEHARSAPRELHITVEIKPAVIDEAKAQYHGDCMCEFNRLLLDLIRAHELVVSESAAILTVRRADMEMTVREIVAMHLEEIRKAVRMAVWNIARSMFPPAPVPLPAVESAGAE